MEARERNVQYYQQGSGRSPFRDWRAGITDGNLKGAVDARIARLRSGNFGDSKSVGSGVLESRIDFGPGYRIYYGMDGHDVILLAAGDKSTQSTDIQLARSFWEDYKRRMKQERTKKDAKETRLQGGPSRRPKK